MLYVMMEIIKSGVLPYKSTSAKKAKALAMRICDAANQDPNDEIGVKNQ